MELAVIAMCVLLLIAVMSFYECKKENFTASGPVAAGSKVFAPLATIEGPLKSIIKLNASTPTSLINSLRLASGRMVLVAQGMSNLMDEQGRLPAVRKQLDAIQKNPKLSKRLSDLPELTAAYSIKQALDGNSHAQKVLASANRLLYV